MKRDTCVATCPSYPRVFTGAGIAHHARQCRAWATWLHDHGRAHLHDDALCDRCPQPVPGTIIHEDYCGYPDNCNCVKVVP